MNSHYFCIQCEKLHLKEFSSVKENVFKSGFHFYKNNLYNAGICNKQQTIPLTFEDQSLKLLSQYG
jgi:hypothetical protein